MQGPLHQKKRMKNMSITTDRPKNLKLDKNDAIEPNGPKIFQHDDARM